MAQAPYQPMHGPRKEVSQQAMWDTLEKHGGKRPQAGQSPKEKPAIALMKLDWQKPVRTGEGCGYLLSQCGRFSIEKRPVRGIPMYMAWKRGEPPTSLGIRPELAEAKHLCELANNDPPQDPPQR